MGALGTRNLASIEREVSNGTRWKVVVVVVVGVRVRSVVHIDVVMRQTEGDAQTPPPV